MDRILFPVYFKDTVLLPVKIKLIHAEGYRKILGLPLLLVGILISHADFFHDLPASGIIHIVGGSDER